MSEYINNLKNFVTDSTTGLVYEGRKDKIVENVKEILNKRSSKGIKEYGTTLEDNPDGFYKWLNDIQEELLDAALYIEKIKKINKN